MPVACPLTQPLVDDANHVVVLGSGFRETDLTSFRAAVMRDIQAGAKPEDALRTNVPGSLRP